MAEVTFHPYHFADAMPIPKIAISVRPGASGHNHHRSNANEPLSLTLSPLRGARELPSRVVVVSRCARHDGLPILRVELCARPAHTAFMRRFGFIIAIWMGLLWHGADAGSYALTDGSRVSGEPINYDQTGVMLKTGDDSFPLRISWGKFTDEALRQLRDDAKTLQQRALVEPMVSDDIPALKKQYREISVKQIYPPVRPDPHREHLGLLAVFSSPLGWVMLLVVYAANLFAAYEVAIFRNQPVLSVCGLAAIPLFGVASPIFFLALPTRPHAEDRSSPAKGAAVQASYAPPTLPSAAADGGAAPVASEGFSSFAPRGLAGQKPVAAGPPQEELPAPVVYQRGDFSFNRRFFETKLAGFFRVVLSEADKDLLIRIKAARGDYVGKRICRVTPSELYLQVFKESATAEEMIPFVEIIEVEIRHKDLI